MQLRSQFNETPVSQRAAAFLRLHLLSIGSIDIRLSPLHERKRKLKSVSPSSPERLLFCDRIEESGEICTAWFANMIWKALSVQRPRRRRLARAE